MSVPFISAAIFQNNVVLQEHDGLSHEPNFDLDSDNSVGSPPRRKAPSVSTKGTCHGNGISADKWLWGN